MPCRHVQWKCIVITTALSLKPLVYSSWGKEQILWALTIVALTPCFREPMECGGFIFNYAFRICVLHPVGPPCPSVKWTWLRLLISSNSSWWPMDVPASTEIDISLDLIITKRYEHLHLPSYIHPNSYRSFWERQEGRSIVYTNAVLKDPSGARFFHIEEALGFLCNVNLEIG